MIILHKLLNERLSNAQAVMLIPDIWEHSQVHYLGLVAALINKSLEKELYILGINDIESRSVEDVKFKIEDIVNNFKFEKSTINGLII